MRGATYRAAQTKSGSDAMTARLRTHLLSIIAGFASVVTLMPSARAADSFDIHAVMPLTGGGSFLGQGEQQALVLAEKVVNSSGGINGAPIHFIFHDDQSSPQVAVQLTNEVIANKPAVMLGSSLVAMCSAIGPIVQQNGPVDYCFSPGIHPQKGSYSFTSSVSTLDLANAVIRYFRLKGWTRLALMFSTDASGQDAERGIKSVLDLPENKAMSIVQIAHFATSDVNVSAQLENVKAANPQAFIAWSTGAPIATIFRAMIQAGLDVPTATTDGNMTRAQMTQYESFLPKQIYFPAAEWVVANDPKFPMEPAVAEKQKAFYAAFKAANAQADIASELAWDPAMIVVDALKKLGPKASAQQIRDYLVGLKGYSGINGIYDFTDEPQRGLTVANAVVTRWSTEAKTWHVVSKATGVPLD
jgi:branched-chain amino acid transport system substrate-binding protein